MEGQGGQGDCLVENAWGFAASMRSLQDHVKSSRKLRINVAVAPIGISEALISIPDIDHNWIHAVGR